MTKTIATHDTMSAWFWMKNSWLKTGGFLVLLCLRIPIFSLAEARRCGDVGRCEERKLTASYPQCPLHAILLSKVTWLRNNAFLHKAHRLLCPRRWNLKENLHCKLWNHQVHWKPIILLNICFHNTEVNLGICPVKTLVVLNYLAGNWILRDNKWVRLESLYIDFISWLYQKGCDLIIFYM